MYSCIRCGKEAISEICSIYCTLKILEKEKQDKEAYLSAKNLIEAWVKIYGANWFSKNFFRIYIIFERIAPSPGDLKNYMSGELISLFDKKNKCLINVYLKFINDNNFLNSYRRKHEAMKSIKLEEDYKSAYNISEFIKFVVFIVLLYFGFIFGGFLGGLGVALLASAFCFYQEVLCDSVNLKKNKFMEVAPKNISNEYDLIYEKYSSKIFGDARAFKDKFWKCIEANTEIEIKKMTDSWNDEKYIFADDIDSETNYIKNNTDSLRIELKAIN